MLADGWCGEQRHEGGTTDLARVYKLNGKPPPFDPADPFGLAAAPALAGRHAAASSGTPGHAPDGPPARTGRLQRRTGRIAGDGYALLPAAAGYVDPLHAGTGARTAAGLLRLATVLTDHWGLPSLPAALDRYAEGVGRELDREDALVAPCYDALPDWPRFRRALLPRHAAAARDLDAAAANPDAEYLLADDGAFTAAGAAYFTRLAAGDETGLDDDLRRTLEPWGGDHPAVRAMAGT